MDVKIRSLLLDISRELKADYWSVTDPETTIEDVDWGIVFSSCTPGEEWPVSIFYDDEDETWTLYINEGVVFIAHTFDELKDKVLTSNGLQKIRDICNSLFNAAHKTNVVMRR